MTVANILERAAKQLQPKKITCAADKGLGRLEAEVLLAFVMKKDRVWLIANREFRVASSELRVFQALVKKRKRHEPIAYLTGEKDFYGRAFRVSPAVLIPRPETEQIVDLVKAMKPSAVWDVGTGSGCIAVTLAAECPKAKILGTDLDPKALAIARQNAKRYKATNAAFKKGDLLDRTALDWILTHAPRTSRRADRRLVITANLPYLPNADKRKLEPDVVKYEPFKALFGGPKGSEVIEKLLRQIAALDLHADVILECDPPEALDLARLARSLFPHFSVRTYKDLAKHYRIVTITSAFRP